MRSTLVDAGPLIALFDRDDAYHETVKSFMEGFRGKLLTTWPVITETSHMLSFSLRAQVGFMTWLKRNAMQVFPLEIEHIDRLIQLMTKYSTLPLDLADGSLLIAAEKYGILEILTIDSDYSIYRTSAGKTLRNVLRKRSSRKDG
jgi:predicted nucleic acid-binding protein